jgi:hypothetical protein
LRTGYARTTIHAFDAPDTLAGCFCARQWHAACAMFAMDAPYCAIYRAE